MRLTKNISFTSQVCYSKM